MKISPALSLTIAAIALMGGSTVFAQVNTSYAEHGKLMRAPEAISALGSNLFGDQVNLYTGAIEFVQTDISLPSNSALPVQVARRFVAGRQGLGGGLFDDWDLEVPHIHGVFADRGNIWPAFDNSTNRCGSYGNPPTVTGDQGQANFSAAEYWHGNMLYIPGIGDQDILVGPTTGLMPTAPLTTSPLPSTYPLATKGGWKIGCIPLSNGAGEGFLAISPDGTQYRFDRMVSRLYPAIFKSTLTAQSASFGPAAASSANGYFLTRLEVWILASEVKDRHGNTVTYNYAGTNSWNLSSIDGSDGRKLAFTYGDSFNPRRVKKVTAIGANNTPLSAWSYSYIETPAPAMSSVKLPDDSTWTFALNDYRHAMIILTNPLAEACDFQGNFSGSPATATMTHPSGASGSFTFTPTHHGRSYTVYDCRNVGQSTDGSPEWPMYPATFDTMALTNKTISGVGLASLSWKYKYNYVDDPQVGAVNQSYISLAYPCTATAPPSCIETKDVGVIDPENNLTKYTFGTRFRVTEGQLQKTEVYGGPTTAASLLRATAIRNRAPNAAGSYPPAAGTSIQPRGDGEMGTFHTPEDQRIITQQGIDFTWEAAAGTDGFDSLARPTAVTKSSSVGTTTLHSRTETTVYEDNTGKWVMGQTKSVTSGSKVMVDNVYNATTANLFTVSHFGKVDQTFTYNADGTLSSRADGLNQVTGYTSYKRSIARLVTFADGKSESAVVNDLGLIDSVVDAAGQSTSYGYDAMGRLNSITRPNEVGLIYAATSLAFEPVPASEYGLAPGHWRQTVTTGNAKTVQYYDALWRPLLTRTYDNADETATRRMVLRKFDSGGRTTAESYAARSIASISTGVNGTTTTFDTLGRAKTKVAASELGPLSTVFAYPTYAASDPGPKKTTTDPRNNISTTTFQAFDQPSEDSPILVAAPETTTVTISRDIFGKPSSITRSGESDGTIRSATRSYVYDTHERLCKTLEPEVGATIQQYDGANNVTWRVTGLSAPTVINTTACNQDIVAENRKSNFSYDPRNRLLNTTFGDGSPSIARTYKDDGLPDTVSVGNINAIAPGSSKWTYEYNNRRLLKSETIQSVAP